MKAFGPVFEQMIDHLPIMVFGKDVTRDLRYTFWNRKAEELLGLTKAQVIGKTNFEIWPADQATFFREQDLVTLRTGETVEIPEELVLNRWFHTLKITFNDEAGNPRLLIGIAQDISKLKISNERLQIALSSIHMGVWEWDMVTQVLRWDDNMLKLYDLPRAQFTGTGDDWNRLTHPEDRARIHFSFLESIVGDRELNETYRVICPDGSIRTLACKGRVIRSPEGTPLRAVGVSWDISREVATERLIAEQQAKMLHSAKMSALGEMASGIAHEINNPLAIIAGKATQIKGLLDDPQPEKYFATVKGASASIENTVHRIAKIVRGLRALARPDHQLDILRPITIHEVVANSLDLCQNRFREHSIELRVDLDHLRKNAQNFRVRGRGVQLEQVMLNLLTNAFDAVISLAVTEPRWVELSVDCSHEWLRVLVRDSGPGIPVEMHEQIFEPFFSTKEVSKGTGLGLSISRSILHQHDGRLQIDSTAACTTFIIELPRQKLPIS